MKFFFNEPWMDNLDPGLLFRYWLKKRSPSILILRNVGGLTLICARGEVRGYLRRCKE